MIASSADLDDRCSASLLLRRDASEARRRSVALRPEAALTCASVAALLAQARETHAAAFRVMSGPRDPGALPAPEPVVPTGPSTLDALDGADLDDVVGDLIAAYRGADARGDAEATEVLARSLTRVGRYLAGRLGPRAVGLVLH